ncbi:hypothetical protein Svir_05150 [Saccharomonospora viridis DSM 43017]|uniref:Uncharacterized protein n=1 Tax=Saccharomonospora viridis (strain ATCC 15386 / DSM 43017 / JCM 3036 / CCUG 5913 / NBRC 12207 / NCIMB 9602 / P101) TaxID=471857 RepID=C7MUM6_SACVD|nr:hypothetical protein Svir_05150 [Saccharomonospora viridis DSM 43017]
MTPKADVVEPFGSGVYRRARHIGARRAKHHPQHYTGNNDSAHPINHLQITQETTVQHHPLRLRTTAKHDDTNCYGIETAVARTYGLPGYRGQTES